MAADDELPWTTSRCTRLLRPLSSKLAKLRKEVEKPRAQEDQRSASSAFATRGSPQKTTNFTRPANKPRGFDKARDPDWRPGAKPGVVKRTYGGRGAKRASLQRNISNVGNNSRPGEVAFTPLIARIGGELQSSPLMHSSPLKKYTKSRGPLRAPIDAEIAKGMPVDVQRLVQGLSEAYANLLQATVTGNEKRWKGTRSLVGACLRKLPAYIELEEHFAKLDKLEEDEDEDRDVANEVYEHLEAQFEQRIGQGWRPFKQVVRAHGTSLVCGAIADEVLDSATMSILVTHCLNVAAWDEAEKIILAYVPHLEPLTMPINIKADLFDSQKSLYLSVVKDFVNRTGRHRFLFDLLEHMIALELLPLEWLATECMRPVWDRMIRSISEHDHRMLENAFRFMETSMLASTGLPDERLRDEETGSIVRRFVPSSRIELRQALATTFSSLLTVLCSITLVNNAREDTVGRNVAERITWALNAIIINIASRNDIQAELNTLNADADDSQTFAQRALWLNLATFLLRIEGCVAGTGMMDLSSTTLTSIISWISLQYSSPSVNICSILSTIPSLVSLVSRGTGRIWKDDGFDQLQRFIPELMALSRLHLPHKLWTLKRLALESAMEYAHETGDAQHMAYARDIEKKMRTQGHLKVMQSPQRNASLPHSGGFRWEDGIGEWVACTPFVQQEVRSLGGRPSRALRLLPTPAQSESEDASPAESSGAEDELPGNESSVWETTEFMDEDEDEDIIPQSSPIKHNVMKPVSSLGKRTRAQSPQVVIHIPAKRVQLTPPDSPEEVQFSDTRQDEPHRSRRTKNDLQALRSRLHTQRSRTSLESGLRSLSRPTYTEVIDLNDSDERASSSSSDGADAGSSEPAHQTSHRRTHAPRLRSLRTHAPPTHARPVKRRRRGQQHADLDLNPKTSNEGHEGHEGHDELGTTPLRPHARPRQKKIQRKHVVRATRQWWKVSRDVVVHDDHEESEDELSFH